MKCLQKNVFASSSLHTCYQHVWLLSFTYNEQFLFALIFTEANKRRRLAILFSDWTIAFLTLDNYGSAMRSRRIWWMVDDDGLDIWMDINEITHLKKNSWFCNFRASYLDVTLHEIVLLMKWLLWINYKNNYAHAPYITK